MSISMQLSAAPLGALVNLSGPGHYVHWGFIQLSVANLVVIGLMILVFVAAIVVPFRLHRSRSTVSEASSTATDGRER